jgi:hypothetical protein
MNQTNQNNGNSQSVTVGSGGSAVTTLLNLFLALLAGLGLNLGL